MSEIAKPSERFDYDKRTGKFDDIFLHDVDVHIEALGAGEFFIGIYKPGGTQYVLNANKARVSWVHVPDREPTPAERLVAAVTERGDEYVREQIRQRRTSPVPESATND